MKKVRNEFSHFNNRRLEFVSGVDSQDFFQNVFAELQAARVHVQRVQGDYASADLWERLEGFTTEESYDAKKLKLLLKAWGKGTTPQQTLLDKIGDLIGILDFLRAHSGIQTDFALEAHKQSTSQTIMGKYALMWGALQKYIPTERREELHAILQDGEGAPYGGEIFLELMSQAQYEETLDQFNGRRQAFVATFKEQSADQVVDQAVIEQSIAEIMEDSRGNRARKLYEHRQKFLVKTNPLLGLTNVVIGHVAGESKVGERPAYAAVAPIFCRQAYACFKKHASASSSLDGIGFLKRIGDFYAHSSDGTPFDFSDKGVTFYDDQPQTLGQVLGYLTINMRHILMQAYDDLIPHGSPLTSVQVLGIQLEGEAA